MEYFINRDKRNSKNRYKWLFGGWSFCSTSCGNGTRHKIIICKDEQTGKIVSRRKCPLMTKPSHEIEKCNGFRYSSVQGVSVGGKVFSLSVNMYMVQRLFFVTYFLHITAVSLNGYQVHGKGVQLRVEAMACNCANFIAFIQTLMGPKLVKIMNWKFTERWCNHRHATPRPCPQILGNAIEFRVQDVGFLQNGLR